MEILHVFLIHWGVLFSLRLLFFLVHIIFLFLFSLSYSILLQSHWHGPLGSVYEIATVKDRSKANTQPPPQLLRGAPLHSCESITTTSSDDDDCKSGSGGGIAVAEHGVW
jgi:hypothetical protein